MHDWMTKLNRRRGITAGFSAAVLFNRLLNTSLNGMWAQVTLAYFGPRFVAKKYGKWMKMIVKPAFKISLRKLWITMNHHESLGGGFGQGSLGNQAFLADVDGGSRIGTTRKKYKPNLDRNKSNTLHRRYYQIAEAYQYVLQHHLHQYASAVSMLNHGSRSSTVPTWGLLGHKIHE